MLPAGYHMALKGLVRHLHLNFITPKITSSISPDYSHHYDHQQHKHKEQKEQKALK